MKLRKYKISNKAPKLASWQNCNIVEICNLLQWKLGHNLGHMKKLKTNNENTKKCTIRRQQIVYS